MYGPQNLLNTSVNKHGINPPTVYNLNETFIEISSPVSDFTS